VYVAGGWSGTLSIIDAAKDSIIAEVPVGKRPWGVDVSSDGRFVYTANGMSDDIAVVDAASRRVVARIPVGKRPWGVVVTRN
jgi:YVTN family beta-propeller protein